MKWLKGKGSIAAERHVARQSPQNASSLKVQDRIAIEGDSGGVSPDSPESLPNWYMREKVGIEWLSAGMGNRIRGQLYRPAVARPISTLHWSCTPSPVETAVRGMHAGPF